MAELPSEVYARAINGEEVELSDYKHFQQAENWIGRVDLISQRLSLEWPISTKWRSGITKSRRRGFTGDVLHRVRLTS